MKNACLILFVLAVAANAQTTPSPAALAEHQKLNAEVVRLYGTGNYNDAIGVGEKAVKSAEMLFGEKHLETSLALRNLGFAQVSAKEMRSAEKSLDRSYSIFAKLPASAQTDPGGAAAMLETLGFIKVNLKDDGAKEIFEASLEWFKKAYGDDALESRRTLKALAEIFFAQKDFDKATEFHRRRLGLLARSPSILFPEVMLAFKQTECSYRKAKRETEFVTVEADYEKAMKANPRASERDLPTAIEAGTVAGKAEFLAKPQVARGAGDATVRVELMFDEKGVVIFACAVSGPPTVLIENSERAAYASRFKPVSIQGKPIIVSGFLIYRFQRF